MKNLFPFARASRSGEVSSQNWFYSRQEFLRKSQWLILWRLVLISFFLLLTVLLQEKENVSLFPLSFSRIFYLFALQYFVSIIYIVLLMRGKPAPWKAVIQLLGDGLFVTAVVYCTGGIESFFPYLYFLIIVAGGTIFYRLGGLLTALYVVILYGLLLFLQGFNLILFYCGLSGPIAPFVKKYFLYQFFMHGIGFFCVGFFSSTFAEQTRKQWGQIEIQRESIGQLEELNRIVIENIDIGLITLDHDDKILSINPAGETILGRTSEEVKYRSLQGFFPGFDNYLPPKAVSFGNRGETAYSTPDGRSITLGFSITPVKKVQSHGIGKILSFKDISKIKVMEEHLRKVDRLAILGKMAAGIAHEIRNPLASISGSIQVLKDDFKEEGTGERLLKIVSREVSRLDSLMNDFLAFAKPVQVIESQLDLSEFIHGTVDLVKKNKEVPPTITWELDIKPNLIINMSTGELSQILWNLLMNAMQAVPPNGKITIRAQHYRAEPDEDWVEIKIEDDGPGIPLNEQAKIFEPFFTTKDQGTGLGLSIVQKIISERGGKIRVDSLPGQGSQFIILIPIPGDRTLTKSRDLS
jgi:two-component system sensor histidine kinase PilS (NtrC family)